MKIKPIALSLAMAAVLAAPALAQLPTDITGPLLGAAWYPEQWPESRWDADLTLMEKAHMHVVRVGEFAWTAMEPSEGHYDLDWLDRAISMAAKHHIQVILGTPTAAVPVWMEAKYPDVEITDANGVRSTGTTRNHNNWNSARYLAFVRQIDEKLAQRFGKNPNVIAWQLDNELPHQSFDADAVAQWHAWLRARYGSIEKLNAVWTTAYDNQTFSSFDEVPLIENGRSDNNPGLWLDSKRFSTDSLRKFFRVQIDALHKYIAPSQKITTNFMPWYDYFDHYPIAADLDFVSIDNPQVQGELDPIHNGTVHDVIRGMKEHGNYWVMESTAGPRGGGNASVQLPIGAMRAAVWSYVGHGADLISYWQWRDALNGGEANHGAIIDVDGEPDHIYSEWAQIGAEFEKTASVLAGTHVEASVALLHNYPSQWDIGWQPMTPDYKYLRAVQSYYEPLHKLGYTVDIVPPDRDLSHYKLVVAPALMQLSQKELDNLAAYVKGGGHLVMGQRTAMKDDTNSRWPQRQPGPLRALLGGYVFEYQVIDKKVSASGTWGDNSKGQLFTEELKIESPDTKALMTYHAPHHWIDGQPAAITRAVADGRITYIGAWFDDATMRRAMQWAVTDAKAMPDTFPVPDDVDVYRRSDAKRDIYIVVSNSESQKAVKLPKAMQDLLHGGEVTSITLDAYGVALFAATR